MLAMMKKEVPKSSTSAWMSSHGAQLPEAPVPVAPEPPILAMVKQGCSTSLRPRRGFKPVNDISHSVSTRNGGAKPRRLCGGKCLQAKSGSFAFWVFQTTRGVFWLVVLIDRNFGKGKLGRWAAPPHPPAHYCLPCNKLFTTFVNVSL